MPESPSWYTLQLSEVASLKKYSDVLDASDARIEVQVATPVSQVDPVVATDFINHEKSILQDCESDIKDAKRRITAEKRSRGLIKPKKNTDQNDRGDDPSDSEGTP